MPKEPGGFLPLRNRGVMFFLAVVFGTPIVFLFPVVHDGVRGPRQPARVLVQCLEFSGRKIFRAGWRRMSKRPEQTG